MMISINKFSGFNGEGNGADTVSYLYTHKEFSFAYNGDQVRFQNFWEKNFFFFFLMRLNNNFIELK